VRPFAAFRWVEVRGCRRLHEDVQEVRDTGNIVGIHPLDMSRAPMVRSTIRCASAFCQAIVPGLSVIGTILRRRWPTSIVRNWPNFLANLAPSATSGTASSITSPGHMGATTRRFRGRDLPPRRPPLTMDRHLLEESEARHHKRSTPSPSCSGRRCQ